MHGPDVLHLQQLLAKHGYLHHDQVDGAYGKLTAQAVYRAKYWFGYRRPDHTAGRPFAAYLAGSRKPSPAMRALRAIRLKRKPKMSLGRRALAYLASHLGETESPAGSNRVPWASLWYGIVGPWCAMSVSRAYVAAGSKAFQRGRHYSYVPYIVADARAGRNNLALTRHPEPGDLVCYDWNHDGVADHVGLFEAWITPGARFHAVEGNTSSDDHGSQSNGGGVYRRQRDASLVQAFVHVGR